MMADMLATHPESWAEFPTECLWYAGFAIIWQLLFGLPFLFDLIEDHWTDRPMRREKVTRWLFFNTSLLAAGSVLNGIWSCTVWGNLYLDEDSLVDFSPLLPLFDWSHLTVPAWRMMAVWAAFTITCWLLMPTMVPVS